jgi:anti-sigma regulatory factor (Ser/Thr protein kinase)
MHVHRFLHSFMQTVLHLHDMGSKIANAAPVTTRTAWGLTMIVDQADDVAAPPAPNGRPRHDPSPAPDPARLADPPAPAVVPGLAGLWPAPPTGVPRTARQVLAADPGSARKARAFTLATLREWGLDAAAEDVVAAVSELVTNALQHGLRGLPRPLPSTPIQVVLLGHPRRVVAAVTDPGDRVPEPVAQDPDRFDEGGRGLMVVGAVSGARGWAPLATGGKAVWAAFELPVPKRRTA